MKKQIHAISAAKHNGRRLGMIAAGMTCWACMTAAATPIGQLGILDSTANGGINPATGEPWKTGDTYRLAFVTSVPVCLSTSADINYYNTNLTAFANAAGLAGNWFVIGGTSTVAARDNTGTNPTVATGVGIFKTDGLTKIADNNADLWDGSLDSLNIDLDENGNQPAGTSVYNGSATNGTINPTQPLGSTATNPLIAYGINTATASNPSYWISQYRGKTANNVNFYAMSDVLTVTIGSPPVAAVDPKITSITSVGTDLWEVTLEGEPDTAYSFYSAPDLVFDPGTLVNTLQAATVAVGTISSGSVLTTNSSGAGAAKMTLTGPANFVRGQTAPPQ